MDTKLIFQIKQEINELIKKHPDLKNVQAELDVRLHAAGNANNRLVLMNEILFKSVQSLNNALEELLKKVGK